MERVGFMTFTAASHQGAIKEPTASILRTSATSQCGKIYINPPKCIDKKRGHHFYSRWIIVAATGAMSWDAVFRCESESTLFGLPKEDTTRNQWLSCIHNTVPERFNPNIRVCALCSAFYGGLFPEHGRVRTMSFVKIGVFQKGGA